MTTPTKIAFAFFLLAASTHAVDTNANLAYFENTSAPYSPTSATNATLNPIPKPAYA